MTTEERAEQIVDILLGPPLSREEMVKRVQIALMHNRDEAYHRGREVGRREIHEGPENQ